MAEYPGAAWAGVSPNRSDRQGKVRLFIVHHYAGTQDPASARARFMSSNDRSVSPNYQVNADGSVYEIVPPDRFRAWTTGTIDHQAVTCETQNTSGAPSWGISRESHEAIARLVAWASQRYGFPIQRGRVNDGNVVAIPGVVGHRETPAGRQTSTSCPGPSMDLEWIVDRARQIAGGSPAGGNAADTREWDEMATEEQIRALIRQETTKPGFFIIHGDGTPEGATDPRNGRWTVVDGVLAYVTDASIGFLNSWSTTDGKALASRFKDFATTGNPGAFDDFCRIHVADWPSSASGVPAYLAAKRASAGA